MEKIPCYYAYDGLVIVNEHVSDLTTIFLQLKQNQIHPTLALTYFDSINVMKIHHYFSISGLLAYEKRFLCFWTWKWKKANFLNTLNTFSALCCVFLVIKLVV